MDQFPKNSAFYLMLLAACFSRPSLARSAEEPEQAKAQLTASSAGDSSKLDHAKVVTVHVKRSDIAAEAKPQFIKSRDLSDVLADKIKLLAVTLTERQGGSNRTLVDIAGNTAQLSHEAYLKRQSILHYEEPEERAKVDGDKIRVFLLGQTRKSGEVKFKEAFPIVDRIRQGLSYKLSMAGGSSGKAAPPAAPQIRYSLVVQDIMPTSEAPMVASLGSMQDTYEQYSRPAHVVYTIDRVGEDSSSQKVFSSVGPSPESPSASRSALKIFQKPSTDLDLKVEAANSEDSVSDKVGSGALPGGKVTLSQADGLVSTQVITNSRLGKESINYETKLPIIGEASVSRKYDEKFKTTVTSLNNILVAADAPKLNVHHLVLEERYKAELLMKKSNFDLGVAVEPRKGWSPGKKTGLEGDRVSVSLLTLF